MFDAEIKELKRIGKEAEDAIRDGRFTRARRALARLKHTFLVYESDCIRIPLEAKLQCALGKPAGAKKLLINQMPSCWGDPETLEALRGLNPPVTGSDFMYELRVMGGGPLQGTFPGRVTCDFFVLAENQTAALAYVKEITHYAEPAKAEVIRCAEYDFDRAVCTNQGVYTASFFNPDSEAS